MKNTLMKVWGIVLTVAILSGLLMASVPVSAASSTDSWVETLGPSVVMGTNTDVYTVADDGTIYLWTAKTASLAQDTTATSTSIIVNSTEGFPDSGTIAIGGNDIDYTSKTANTFVVGAAGAVYTAKTAVEAGTGTIAAALYKSTDEGKTWTVVAGGNRQDKVTTWVPNSDALSFIKVCPSDTTQLIALGDNTLFRSTNGGKTWNNGSAAADIGGSATIVSADIIEGDNDISIVVGTDDGVYLYDPNDMNWIELGNLANINGVAFSPDYEADGLVIAYYSDDTISYWDGEAEAWADYLSDATIDAAEVPAGIISVSFAFGTDFSYDAGNRFFMGVNAATNGGVFRVIGKTVASGADSDVINTADGFNVTSLVVDGTSKSNTITAGTDDGQIIYSTDADTATKEWTWVEVTDEESGIINPIGANINLQMNDGVFYAGTNGDNTGFFVAADGKAYKGIAFAEVENVYTCSITNYGAFAWVTDTNSITAVTSNQLFKSGADGWVMVLNSPDGTGMPTGAFGSQVSYFTLPGKKVMMKTENGGDTWYTINTPGRKIASWLEVVDDNTYWIGYEGHIISNGGVSYEFASNTETPGDIWFLGDTGILIKTTSAGTLVNYYYSDDAGSSWDVIGTSGKYSTCPTTFDAASKTIYVVKSNEVYKWVLDTNTEWELTSLGRASTTETITGIALINGAYYIQVSSADTTVAQILRSTDTIVADYRPLLGSSIDDLGGMALFFFGWGNPDGSSFISTVALADPAKKTLGYAGTRNLGYTDSIIVPIATNSPATGDQVNSPLSFNWAATSYVKGGTYSLDVAYDELFLMKVSGYPVKTTNTTVLNASFDTGTTYYWRVRLESVAQYAADANGAYTKLTSKWSETRSFTIKTMGTTTFGIDDPDSVYPSRGATSVSTLPVLTWGIVPGATYNVKVATDSAFTNIVDSKDGLTVAVYTPAKALNVNTTYYWEVQAVANGIPSDWVGFAFTTASAPQATETVAPTATAAAPVITVTNEVPAAPQPTVVVTVNPDTTGGDTGGTPAWAWVVIAIGAVLVIAVIVLIVRTRKV